MSNFFKGAKTGARCFSRVTDFRHQALCRASFYEFDVVLMGKDPSPSDHGEEEAAGSRLQRQDAVVEVHDESQLETSSDMDLPMGVPPECLDGCEHQFLCGNCGWNLPDNVAMSGELNDVVNPFVKASGSTGVSQNLWIPLVGRHIAGNYQMTSQELLITAFGLDLRGMSVTNPKKGSIS